MQRPCVVVTREILLRNTVAVELLPGSPATTRAEGGDLPALPAHTPKPNGEGIAAFGAVVNKQSGRVRPVPVSRASERVRVDQSLAPFYRTRNLTARVPAPTADRTREIWVSARAVNTVSSFCHT